jgi:hypothetical protein
VENISHVDEVIHRFLNDKNFVTYTSISRAVAFDTDVFQRDVVSNETTLLKNLFLFGSKLATLCFFKMHFKFKTNVKNIRPLDFGGTL